MSFVCKRLFSYGRVIGVVPQNKNNLDFKNINVFVVNECSTIHNFKEKINKDELIDLSDKPFFLDYNTVNYTIIETIKCQNQEFYTAPLPSRPISQ